MGLSVVPVVTAGTGATPNGSGHFLVRPRGGWYELPGLDLKATLSGALVTRVSAELADPATPALDRAVQAAVSRMELPRGTVTSPVHVPGPVLAQAAVRAPCRLRLHFRLDYQETAAPGGPLFIAHYRTGTDMSVHLEPEPASEQQPTSDDEKLSVQPVPRRRPDRRHQAVAALDFGTSRSTVTLCSPWRPIRSGLPPSQSSVLGSQVLELLRASPDGLPAGCEEDWQSILDDLARIAGLGEGDAERRLRAALSNEPGNRAGELHRVMLILEHLCLDYSDSPLHAWLAHRMYRCYDRAFATPALDFWSLFRVELDSATRATEIPSRVEVSSLDPLTVTVGEYAAPATELSGEQEPDRPRAGHTTFLALKQQLNDWGMLMTAAGTEVSALSLITAAYQDLVTRTDEYIARFPEQLGSGRLDDLIITYPTMAGPGVRARLEELARTYLGVSGVEMRFDEAAAAAFFLLMRDLGADLATGIEALKARSHPVGEERRQWRSNMMVVDIGGGSTDIGLMTLSIRDETPDDSAVPAQEAGSQGRYYRLVPTLRGAGGDAQHGGDHLTLEVFHWLKALIADRVLAAWTDWAPITEITKGVGFADIHPRAFADYMASQAAAESHTLLPAAPRIDGADEGSKHAAMERLVPTHWADNDTRRPLFDAIWNLAEETKIRLGVSLVVGADWPGGPEPETPAADLADIMAMLQVQHAGAAAVADPPPQDAALSQPLTLAPQVFRELAGAHVKAVCERAKRLVEGRLDGEPLDRLILTGRASQLPLAEEMFTREFGHAVTVAGEYAKGACSVGASFAKHLREFGHEKPENAIKLLANGETVVHVDVNNLFLELPCAFHRFFAGAQPQLVMSAGDPMFVGHDCHRTRARSDSGALTGRYQIMRIDEGSRVGTVGVTWASFRYVEWVAREKERGRCPQDWDPAEAIWIGRDGQVFTALEIDDRLIPTIHLWRGERPHYVVDEGTVGSLPSPFTGLDGDVVVNRGDDLRSDGQIVFGVSPGTPGPECVETFHVRRAHGADGDMETRSGMLSIGLEPPPASGQWTFEYFPRGSTQPVPVGVAEPLSSEPGTRHCVTLDETGELRIHLGEPPYYQAASLYQVEQDEGSVWSQELVENRDMEWQESRHPFNGRQ